MLYAVLCYDSEELYANWTQAQDDALMAKLGVVIDKLAARGKLGPVARLMPTTTAVTVRKGRGAVVVDGPFAETKEQLLGFYVIECASLADALEVAGELGHASGNSGSFAIRPIAELRASTS